MRIAVVGTEDGKPYIRWGPAILSAIVLAIFASGGAFGMYYLLTGTMSPLAALVGFAGAITAVASGIRRAMKVPASEGRD
jgi:hypothetical protein